MLIFQICTIVLILSQWFWWTKLGRKFEEFMEKHPVVKTVFAICAAIGAFHAIWQYGKTRV